MIADRSAMLYMRDTLLEDFQEIQTDEQNPEFIVMGDLGGAGGTQGNRPLRLAKKQMICIIYFSTQGGVPLNSAFWPLVTV